MIGSSANPCLATKAAETGTLLEFVRDLVGQHRAQLGPQGAALLRVGDGLVSLRDAMRSAPRRLSAQQAQQLVDAAKQAMAHREAAGIGLSPKWHLMLHIVAKAFEWGNPHYYSTFLDESLNGLLAKMAKACHRLTWHRSVLAAFRWASQSRQVRRR